LLKDDSEVSIIHKIDNDGLTEETPHEVQPSAAFLLASVIVTYFFLIKWDFLI
jgi:hypothetical protein